MQGKLPTPVSPAGSVGSRQSATGARSPPPPVRGMSGRGWLVGTGGGDHSIHLISKGAVAPFVSPTRERSHLPVRSALGKRHWRLTPPPTPSYEAGLRSRLPPRSALDGAHWAPGPEPAGETVPPKAAEGVFRGKERAGKSKKSPSLLRAGGRCAGMVHPRGRWGPMPGSPLMGGRAL